jgi:hypothetical protein
MSTVELVLQELFEKGTFRNAIDLCLGHEGTPNNVGQGHDTRKVYKGFFYN